jgi:hypothetical protein
VSLPVLRTKVWERHGAYELSPAEVYLQFPHKGRVPHTPGFPAKFVGVDELHAAFPNESRTRRLVARSTARGSC